MMLMCCSLLSIAGCRGPSDMHPHEVVTRSIDGLSGEDHFLFKGMTEIRAGEREVLTKRLRFEGQVKHHQGMYMRLITHPQKENTTTSRWNPLKLLEELGEAETTVERVEPTKVLYALYAQQGTSKKERGVTEPTFPLDDAQAYHIQVEGQSAKKIFASKVWEDYNQIVLPHEKVMAVYDKLSRSDAARLEQELNEAEAKHRSELDKLLKGCKVDAEYVLWIDRKSQLPLRLDGKMKVYYNDKGKSSETIRTVSEFTRTR